MITKTNLKRVAGIVLRLVVTLACIYWAISQIEDKASFVANFQRAIATPQWVFLGITLGGLSIVSAAFRWYILLRSQQISIHFLQVLRLTIVSSLFTIISFGVAAGDAYKMIYMMRRFRDKKTEITMSVMIDHLAGFISSGVLFIFFVLSSGAIMDTSKEFIQQALIGTLVFNLVGMLVVCLLFVVSSDKMIFRFRERYPRLSEFGHIRQITDSLNLYRKQWRGLLLCIASSMVVSSSYYLVFYASLKSIGFQVSCGTVITVMPLVDAISALPISVAGLGVREKSFEVLLGGLTNISSSAAVSASLIGFTFHLFWALVGGAIWVFGRGKTSNSHKNTETNPLETSSE